MTKKTTSDKDKAKAKTKQKVAKKVKKEVKKEIKRNKPLRVTLIVLAVLIIATIVWLYVFKPDFISNIIAMLKGNSGGGGSGGANGAVGTTPIDGPKLEITVVNVGQGDGIFINFPDGKTMVMDMGTAGGVDNAYGNMQQALAKANVTKLNYVFVTHTDSDHISSMAKLIGDYEVESFHFPKAADDTTATWNKVVKAAREETYTDENGNTAKAKINLNVGCFEIKGDGWDMQCHSFAEEDYPDVKKGSDAYTKNKVSPICVLTYGGRQIVLTGDSNEENEPYILQKGCLDNVDADVLKVAHHGAATSTTQEFLDKIDPEYAIISVGKGNGYGHPKAGLMERLNNYTDVKPDKDYDKISQIYRTDEDGDVIVQVSSTGVLNVISSNNADRNKTQTAIVLVVHHERVVLFAITKEQYEE